jgi:CHAD domain-containing protein
MPLDVRELDSRVQKLRKSLKNFPRNPTVEEVHDLRTRTRRVESILTALNINSKSERKLVAELKPIRRQAGEVRDMDVLTVHAVGLGLEDDPECLVRVVHHLGAQRERGAAKLYSNVRRHAQQLRRGLKQSRRKLDKALERFAEARLKLAGKKDGSGEAPLHAVSEALRLSNELAAVARLDRNNLHAYRIELKRLRYILEMSDGDNPEQKPLLDALKKVQDMIGEWHDWLELSAIAADVLKKHGDCKLVKKIKQTTERKFAEALRATEQMRERYLSGPPRSSRGRKARQPLKPGPVLVAAARIAS